MEKRTSKRGCFMKRTREVPFVPATFPEWLEIVASRYGRDSDAYAILATVRAALHEEDDLGTDSPGFRCGDFVDSIIDGEKKIDILDYISTCVDGHDNTPEEIGRAVARALLDSVGSLRPSARKRRRLYVQEQVRKYLALSRALGFDD